MLFEDHCKILHVPGWWHNYTARARGKSNRFCGNVLLEHKCCWIVCHIIKFTVVTALSDLLSFTLVTIVTEMESYSLTCTVWITKCKDCQLKLVAADYLNIYIVKPHKKANTKLKEKLFLQNSLMSQWKYMPQWPDTSDLCIFNYQSVMCQINIRCKLLFTIFYLLVACLRLDLLESAKMRWDRQKKTKGN